MPQKKLTKNRALVTSTTNRSSKSKTTKRGTKSKMKIKTYSTVISTGGTSKKGAFKTKAKTTSRNTRGTMKTKGYYVNEDGTGTVASNTLRNKVGRTRTIKNKKKAEQKYDRVSKRFQKQADRKQRS